ncbi:hypothetical protein D3C72_2455720 [compost metagenome]
MHPADGPGQYGEEPEGDPPRLFERGAASSSRLDGKQITEVRLESETCPPEIMGL